MQKKKDRYNHFDDSVGIVHRRELHMTKMREKILIGMVGGVFLLLCIMVWFKPDTEYSVSERRKLKQQPEFTVSNIASGRFMSNFEEYTLDQFPFRENFRSFKAVTSLKADNNGLYVVDGCINSMEYPLREEALDYASGKFESIYDKYLKANNCKVYLSIIPDKNYFYGANSGYLTMDYDRFVDTMVEANDYMTYLDIFPLLTGESYYRTDTHWKQECLPQVADCLLEEMRSKEEGNDTKCDEMEGTNGDAAGDEKELQVGADEVVQEDKVDIGYELVEMSEAFYGVYYGQAALPMAPDQINYLTNEIIENYKVFDYQNNQSIPVYDESKMQEDDPYELYLGGPLSLITIENPKCENDKHLIIFRDSFGSSIAPLLAQDYSKTTLIDIRYLQSAVLGNFVDFTDADVLFLYSTMVLNNSETLK